MRRYGLLLALVSFVSLQSFAQCGVERWTIKIGTDAQAPSVDLSTYISTTIYNMRSSTAPSSLPATSRIAPRELTQYRLSGTLTNYKRETDSDYHLVVKDGSGRTMIIEIPSPTCVGSGPFRTGISHARSQFDAKLTATSTMKSASIPITVKGVGFWDYIHGQTGVAPNGIEIHPVLDITFNTTVAELPDGEVSVPPVSLPGDMAEDDDGGRVQLYRGGAALDGILFHGGVVIEHPRLRLVFIGDHWSDAAKEEITNVVRSINAAPEFDSLERYGVSTWGMPFEGRRVFTPKIQLAGAGEMNDLDVQRVLAAAVENGEIQHTSSDVVTIVMLDPEIASTVGESREWQSYHSLFHPTDVAMPYVVVRGGLAPDALREALAASLFRAVVNPAGDGWF